MMKILSYVAATTPAVVCIASTKPKSYRQLSINSLSVVDADQAAMMAAYAEFRFNFTPEDRLFDDDRVAALAGDDDEAKMLAEYKRMKTAADFAEANVVAHYRTLFQTFKVQRIDDADKAIKSLMDMLFKNEDMQNDTESADMYNILKDAWADMSALDKVNKMDRLQSLLEGKETKQVQWNGDVHDVEATEEQETRLENLGFGVGFMYNHCKCDIDFGKVLDTHVAEGDRAFFRDNWSKFDFIRKEKEIKKFHTIQNAAVQAPGVEPRSRLSQALFESYIKSRLVGELGQLKTEMENDNDNALMEQMSLQADDTVYPSPRQGSPGGANGIIN